MPRFFVEESAIQNGKVTVGGEDAHHISYALRMAVGEEITVSDGSGKEYRCKLTHLDGETVTAEILEDAPSLSESPIRIRLYMAYPKGDKLETVIQKAVELGASEIVPFISERCIKRPKEEKQEKLLKRLSKIADEAAKQCGRGKLPLVFPPMSFREVMQDSGEIKLFCYEKEGTLSLKDCLEKVTSTPKTLSVMVGSEGGFSPEEAEEAEKNGFVSVGLGKRILRCETAPDYVLSCISYRFEL